MGRAELSLMSLLVYNQWERPIYFTSINSSGIFMVLDKFLVFDGLVYKLLTIDAGQQEGRNTLVNAQKLYKHAVKDFRWSSLKRRKALDVDTNTYY